MKAASALVCLCLGLLAALASSQLDADKAAELSRYIREHFRETGMNWVSPKMLKGLDLKKNKKPIMYLFTSRSCADCRSVMGGFALKDKTMLSHLSAQFLSVLVLDDYSMYFGPEFEPRDGDYIPRIIFADPDGKLRLDLHNPDSDAQSPYYYGSADEVIGAMQKVLKHYQDASGALQYPGGMDMDM